MIFIQSLMFIIGFLTFIWKLCGAGNINASILSLKSGPIAALTITYSVEWFLLLLSLKDYQQLKILKYITLTISVDNFFNILFSRVILQRHINAGHLFAVLLGFAGLGLTQVITFQGQNQIQTNSSYLTHHNFKYTNTIPSFQKCLPYGYCILSRLFHFFTCFIQKKALIKEAGFDRYKAFKISNFRDIKVKDLDENGNMKKPVVSERSALYKKALFILEEARMASDKLCLTQEEIEAKVQKRIKRRQEHLQRKFIKRQRGITQRREKRMFQQKQHEFTQKLTTKSKTERIDNQVQYLKEDQNVEEDKIKTINPIFTDENSEGVKSERRTMSRGGFFSNIGGTFFETEAEIKFKDELSQEIQELLNDYKYYGLHEHLFDGTDEIWLSRLDDLYDSIILDQELFGNEIPAHFQLMSVIGGFFPIPFFVIISYVTGDNLMGFMDLYDTKLDFMKTFFNDSYSNLVTICIMSFLYMIKPAATTSFILTSPSILSYLTLELLSKIFFTFVTLIFVEKRLQLTAIETLGFVICIMSQIIIYSSSQGYKESREIKSACEAIIKQLGPFNSLEEQEEMKNRLDFLSDFFGTKEVYRILFDVAISDDMKQLFFTGSPSIQLQKIFDPEFNSNTAFWGGGYPRPSSEIFDQSFLVKRRANQRKPINFEECIKVSSENIYDKQSLLKAQKIWKEMNIIKELENEGDEEDNFTRTKSQNNYKNLIHAPTESTKNLNSTAKIEQNNMNGASSHSSDINSDYLESDEDKKKKIKEEEEKKIQQLKDEILKAQLEKEKQQQKQKQEQEQQLLQLQQLQQQQKQKKQTIINKIEKEFKEDKQEQLTNELKKEQTKHIMIASENLDTPLPILQSDQVKVKKERNQSPLKQNPIETFSSVIQIVDENKKGENDNKVKRRKKKKKGKKNKTVKSDIAKESAQDIFNSQSLAPIYPQKQPLQIELKTTESKNSGFLPNINVKNNWQNVERIIDENDEEEEEDQQELHFHKIQN